MARGHNLKIFKNQCKINLRKHSFSNRKVDNWNSLSYTTVNAKDFNPFKNFLDGDLYKLKYIYDKMLSKRRISHIIYEHYSHTEGKKCI